MNKINITNNESGSAAAPTGSHWVTGSYDKLYDQVKGGKRTVCYVDYKWPMHPRSDAMRDICTISSVTMEFVSRGHGYGSVRLMDGDEKTNFIELCKEMNVEWLCEGAAAAGKPYDNLYRLVFSNLAKLRARTQDNWRMVSMADNILPAICLCYRGNKVGYESYNQYRTLVFMS